MQPVRLGGPGQQVTCDQDHKYTNEQKAFNGGAMDRFVENTEGKNCDPTSFNPSGLVMDYYDGNTVTALWNYAQRYAMSDNFYNTTFGPSALGAINLVSANPRCRQEIHTRRRFPDDYVIDNAGNGQGTLINDSQPYGDDCSDRDQVQFSAANKNIGDLLNAKGVTWGFFQGGFKPTATKPTAPGVRCHAQHRRGAGRHRHERRAALRHQTRLHPASRTVPVLPVHGQPAPPAAQLNRDDRAHRPGQPPYDLSNFWAAADAGNLPAVSYLKAAAYQDGHAANSDPLDEQQFLVESINHLQRLPEWRDTAVVIAYDDSDGWYDHQPSPPCWRRHTEDSLNGPGLCGDPAAAAPTRAAADTAPACRCW